MSDNSAHPLVTVTVRREDLQKAIDDIGYAHADYCLSADGCDCYNIEHRLMTALEVASDE